MKDIKNIFVVMLTTIILLFGLGSCSSDANLVRDKEHATLTVVTSTGVTAVAESHNGLNMDKTGEEMATEDPVVVKLHKGESVAMTFECQKCGCSKYIFFDYPHVQYLACNCPENGDKNGNAKEYICIRVEYRE